MVDKEYVWRSLSVCVQGQVFFPAEDFVNIKERFLLLSFILVSSQDLNASKMSWQTSF